MTVKVPYQKPNASPCRLAFVGEAPGDREVEQGKPLVGPSGKVFNALLKSAGIWREDCLVTNVFDEKAPDNDVTPWLKDQPRVDASLKRLAEELGAHKPTVVVPLGATALWALTGQTSINAFRGTVCQATRVVPGVKLVPTFHPAYILRQWKHYVIVVGDLVRAVSEAAKGPALSHPRRRILIDPSVADLKALRIKLLQPRPEADPLSVDIETGWGQITHVGMAWSQEEGLCIPFVDKRSPNRSYWSTLDEECEAWEIVRETLECADVPKVGQFFGGYDCMWLLSCMGIKVYNYRHDTRLLHHALYPELEKSLGFMGAAYGSQGAWKTLGRHSGVEVRKGDD